MAAVGLILVTVCSLFLLDENHGKSDVTVLENLREGTSIVLSRNVSNLNIHKGFIRTHRAKLIVRRRPTRTKGTGTTWTTPVQSLNRYKIGGNFYP